MCPEEIDSDQDKKEKQSLTREIHQKLWLSENRLTKSASEELKCICIFNKEGEGKGRKDYFKKDASYPDLQPAPFGEIFFHVYISSHLKTGEFCFVS